jgi:hypothetical protein
MLEVQKSYTMRQQSYGQWDILKAYTPGPLPLYIFF